MLKYQSRIGHCPILGVALPQAWRIKMQLPDKQQSLQEAKIGHPVVKNET